MSKTVLIFIFSVVFVCALPPVEAQEIPSSAEQQLENQTDADQAETEDDAWLQEMEQFRKNPINLNFAEPDELRQLRILTDLQINNLLLYRELLGRLSSLYELQAVPAWDVPTIKKILPFVSIASPVLLKEELLKRFTGGEHSFIIRMTQVLEKSRGFSAATSGSKYLGSPQRLFFRHRYNYKNLLQFGLAGDKDAGEQFFKGAQKNGFDFYSFHVFARKLGVVQALALGDFTVNLGQGLIHWQSLAFRKSVDVMGIKRQSAILRPYSSAGEFYFHRGSGITIRLGKMEATAFASFRQLSANFVADTVNNEDFISSFLNSGYHRTVNEVSDRNKLGQTTFGGNITYKGKRWHTGINAVHYGFSAPVQKRDEPYNLYAVNGNRWYNVSIDYSYTYKNLHFFGEAAADKNFDKAFVNGLLISADSKVDISVLHRYISKSYQAINGNAFTENTYPTNENGLYIGASIRPANGWRVDAYADIFRFPWLKYLVDAPGNGKDFLAQLTYTPNKQTEIYSRFRYESKQGNQPDNSTVTNFLVYLPRQNWRTQVTLRPSRNLLLRSRAEVMWYDRKGLNAENGFLGFFDIGYKPLMKPLSGILRLQYFETGGYNSRIYAYENDVLYSYSIPAFFDKGFRYYCNLSYDITRKITVWLRWAQTIYRDKESIGSGLDEISGNKRSEMRLQARVFL
ncbi:MAG TPA: hypothetical protein VFV31_08350 [Chitinophagaceae bacterium]|nr:hypothetical protein [Chitinophagaceae bacterium]